MYSEVRISTLELLLHRRSKLFFSYWQLHLYHRCITVFVCGGGVVGEGVEVVGEGVEEDDNGTYSPRHYAPRTSRSSTRAGSPRPRRDFPDREVNEVELNVWEEKGLDPELSSPRFSTTTALRLSKVSSTLVLVAFNVPVLVKPSTPLFKSSCKATVTRKLTEGLFGTDENNTGPRAQSAQGSKSPTTLNYKCIERKGRGEGEG